MAQATYVFGEKEWVLTGRVAKKTSERRDLTKELVEIRPCDITDEDDKSYNKWVNMKDLYHIAEDDDE